MRSLDVTAIMLETAAPNPSSAKLAWPFGTPGFLRGVGPARAACLAGRDSFCSISGSALDTARFGCQNPYPRATDGPGEGGRAKLRKWNTFRYQVFIQLM